MGNLQNLGSAIPGGNPGALNKMSQIPPAYMPPGSGGGFPGSNNPLSGGANPGHQPQSSQPSTQQLRMLVQQIQMAVQAGYLNQQILNQPLAPQTLILLNQLLACIKVRKVFRPPNSGLTQVFFSSNLQQLQTMQSNRQNMNHVQANLMGQKLQQQIKSLQSQINAQQQIYMKTATSSSTPSTNDYLRSPSSTDPMQSLTTSFPELGITAKQVRETFRVFKNNIVKLST